MSRPSGLLEANGTARSLLVSAAADARIVVFCGIPGVGKSLLLREQHALALQAGRRVSRLQWDVARQAFEIPEILSIYPELDGSTHVVIRRGVGLWVRAAIERWCEAHPSPADMLLMEAPLVGGRFTELANVMDDGAEVVLGAQDTRFYVPTPTCAVRLAIQVARCEETHVNRHARDAANASPRVVDELWQMVAATAHRLGFGSPDAASSYSPDLYYRVYQTVLRHRRVWRLPIERVVADQGSPHALHAPADELCPNAVEALGLIARAEAEGAQTISERAAVWYQT
jgi:hypothetical protein